MLPYAVAQWTTEDLSLPRSQIGIGKAGGKVFFAGGVITNSAGGMPTHRKWVDVYDHTTGHFRAMRPYRVLKTYKV